VIEDNLLKFLTSATCIVQVKCPPPELLINSLCGALPKFWRRMIWIDSHSWVDKGVIVGNSRTYPLVFANDLVLLETSNQGLNTPDRF